MEKYLKKLTKDEQWLITLVSNTAKAKGMSVYLVGGLVRDLLLGVENFDLDIVVEGDGISLAQDLSAILGAKFIRHHRFGTATIFKGTDLKIDIATARSECYPQPACLPVVKFGLLKDDLARRDFTINAMAVSLNKAGFGKLLDFFGGRRDLKEKKIRILHDLSFIDDPTRILRAIRFEKRYGFRIESKTLRLLKDAQKKGILNNIEPQRLRDELILMLKEAHPIKAIRRAQQLTKFSFLNKPLGSGAGNYALLNSVRAQIDWYLRSHPKRRKLDSWLVYFMGLVDRLSPKDIERLCSRFAFRRGEEKRIHGFKKVSPDFIKKLSSPGIKPSEIFGMLEPLSYEVILMIKAKHKNVNISRNIENFFKVYNGTKVSISGEDLRLLGAFPGPSYQNIFARLLKAKLDGVVHNRQEELSLAKKIVNNKFK